VGWRSALHTPQGNLAPRRARAKSRCGVRSRRPGCAVVVRSAVLTAGCALGTHRRGRGRGDGRGSTAVGRGLRWSARIGDPSAHFADLLASSQRFDHLRRRHTFCEVGRGVAVGRAERTSHPERRPRTLPNPCAVALRGAQSAAGVCSRSFAAGLIAGCAPGMHRHRHRHRRGRGRGGWRGSDDGGRGLAATGPTSQTFARPRRGPTVFDDATPSAKWVGADRRLGPAAGAPSGRALGAAQADGAWWMAKGAPKGSVTTAIRP
jgi:hypothetical protein